MLCAHRRVKEIAISGICGSWHAPASQPATHKQQCNECTFNDEHQCARYHLGTNNAKKRKKKKNEGRMAG